jgi:hypothetical protein
MSAFSNSLPLGLQTAGLWLGIVLLMFGCIAIIPHWINVWREKSGKPRLMLEPFHLIIFGLIGTLVWAATALGGVIWQQRLSSGVPDKPASTVQTRAPLTVDQREFRIALKQFSLTCVPDLADRVARILIELKSKEKEVSAGSPSSVALHFFIHFALGSSGLNMQSVSIVKGLAEVDVEAIDVKPLQIALQGFFNEYGWHQSAIANMNAIVKIDLLTLESVRQWLNADNNCRIKLQELKIWPEASEIKTIPENKMASVGRLWATPIEVNYY